MARMPSWMMPMLIGPELCDRCLGTAKVRAVLPAGELRFCWHHAREHRNRLIAAGAVLTWDSPTSLRPRSGQPRQQPDITG